MPLSVSEIRRLCWRLVLATQQKVERILAWSRWRRWHQGSARYWHYKGRAGPELGRVDELFDDNPCGPKMNECQKGLAQFLILCSNASKLCEVVEEPFDLLA